MQGEVFEGNRKKKERMTDCKLVIKQILSSKFELYYNVDMIVFDPSRALISCQQ
jgi:hypothetical protein